MFANKSGRLAALLFVTAFLLLGFVGLVLAQEGDAQALGWLKDHRKPVRPDEVVVSGTLFTIVPTSHRMVVKSGNPEKTLVLGFGDDVEVSDGKDNLAAGDLQRGDNLVVVLRRNMIARSIYKAK
jgi:hypothetical protein